MDKTINEIHKQVRLREGADKLREFFTAAYLREGASVKELALSLRLPLPVVAAIKSESEKHGLVAVSSGGVHLTETGKRYVREELRYGTVDIQKLKQVLAAQDIPVPMFMNETAALEEIYRSRPEADVTVDQSLCTAETGIKRALIMLKTGGLIGKNVLFAGDDDLTSVALALVLKSLSSQDTWAETAVLTAADIDERVLGCIEQAAGYLGVKINCVTADFRRPLPEALLANYDAVFTDPPYTLPGLTLFASRAAQALKHEPDLFFYLSCSHKDPAARLGAQRMLSEAGFVINRIYERFNRYYGAQIIGGLSDLTVLSSTPETRPIITGAFTGDMYTNETNRSIREYQCKKCRAAYRVGHSESITTIERLKEKGCAGCGGHTFILRGRITE